MAEDKKKKPAGPGKTVRQKKDPTKLIRLDDLVPKQDVRGGRKTFFGGKETDS